MSGYKRKQAFYTVSEPICMKKQLPKDLEKDLLLSYHTLANLHEDIFWIDSEGKIFKVNDSACTSSGYSREELQSMTVFDMNPSETPQSWKKHWALVKKLKKVTLETRHRSKSGESYEIEVTNNYIEFEGREYSCSVVRNLRKKRIEEDLLRMISEATSSKTGQDFFETLARNVTMALDVDRCIISECMDVEKTRVRTLAYTAKRNLVKNVEYEVEGTPCKLVMQGKGSDIFIPHGVEKDFPREKGYDSFIAVPIYSPTNGDVIGHIAAFDVNPMTNEQNQSSILKIFAERSGAEIDRLSALKKLEKVNSELTLRLKEIEVLKNRLQAENKYLQEEIKLNHNFDEIVSKSKNFQKILQQIEQVASTDSTVLILGESGTGKELIARAIHNISNRSRRPLVKINCAALPANLIESELFGHEKGAFTGAMERKTGRFELANGGTIFLDEIGELPVELQAKLLRVLQEGEFERLGNPVTQRVNVRVIAATNRNLEQAIEKKEFREDLYYRLNVFPVICIPLRERKEDIPLLIRHFCQKYESKVGKRITNVSPEVLDALLKYNWPGNIRELENIIERALILCRGEKLELGDWIPVNKIVMTDSKPTVLAELEREHILDVLQKTNWRISGEKGAAKMLGLNATTLEARIKKLGLQKESSIAS